MVAPKVEQKPVETPISQPEAQVPKSIAIQKVNLDTQSKQQKEQVIDLNQNT